MTRIAGPAFTIEAPGEWTEAEAPEPGSLAWERDDGARIVALLLAVRPLFAIADQRHLLDDYLHHRPQFERGQRPGLSTAQAATYPGDEVEGGWATFDIDEGRGLLHRVVLVEGLLADLSFEGEAPDPATFLAEAGEVLGTAVVTAPERPAD